MHKKADHPDSDTRAPEDRHEYIVIQTHVHQTGQAHVEDRHTRGRTDTPEDRHRHCLKGNVTNLIFPAHRFPLPGPDMNCCLTNHN